MTLKTKEAVEEIIRIFDLPRLNNIDLDTLKPDVKVDVENRYDELLTLELPKIRARLNRDWKSILECHPSWPEAKEFKVLCKPFITGWKKLFQLTQVKKNLK